MRQYWAVFRIRFAGALQYRAAALGGIAAQFAWGFMSIIAYSAFYSASPAAFPMEFSQTVSYVWLHEIFLVMFAAMVWDTEIASAIESGSIAYELVRPVDLYGRWFLQVIANRVAAAMLRCAPILLVAFLLPAPWGLSLPPGAGQFFLFLLSAALALGVVAAFNMLTYISVFYTLSPRGMKLVAGMIADFFAGPVVPLPFFPAPLRAVAELLPFAAMQNMPLRVYSGNIAGMEALQGLALQVFWLTVLWFAGRFAMARALKKVVVQGG